MLLPSGNPFKCHEEVSYLQPMITPKRFDILPYWGMLSRSRCVQNFPQTSLSMIRQIKTKHMQSPDSNWAQCRAYQNLLPTRGKSARYAREFSFARCHDEAVAIILIILHCCPAGNTSRTGEPTSPAAKSAELNDVVRFWRLESK